MKSETPLSILYLKIADFTIGIRFFPIEWPFMLEKYLRDRLILYYQGFLLTETPKKVNYWIDIIHREKFETLIQTKTKRHFINLYEEKSNNTFLSFYHLSNEQFVLLIRKICQGRLSKNTGMIIHASAALIKGKVDIFLGPSGAGKSTITRILSPSYQPLGDDSVIIKREGKGYVFYQTPFHEKNSWIDKNPTKYDLGRIFFLKKGSKNQINKVEELDKINQIMLTQILTNSEHISAQLPSLFSLTANFHRFYEIEFSLNNPEKLIELMGSRKYE